MWQKNVSVFFSFLSPSPFRQNTGKKTISPLPSNFSLISVFTFTTSISSHHFPPTPAVLFTWPPLSLSYPFFQSVIGSCSLFIASHQSSTFLSPYCSTSALTPHPPSLSSLSLSPSFSHSFSPAKSALGALSLLLLPLSVHLLSHFGQVINMEDCVPLRHWVFFCNFYLLFHLFSLSSQPQDCFSFVFTYCMSDYLFSYSPTFLYFFALPTFSRNQIDVIGLGIRWKASRINIWKLLDGVHILTEFCCCLRFTSRSAITKVRQEGDSRREAGGQIQIKGILLGTSPRKKSNTADDSDF